MKAMLEKIVFRHPWIETAGFLLSVFTLTWMKFYHHELWKDEWQAWFVAKDKNFFEVLSFLNYEGHPALWYLYLKPFTWLTDVMPVAEETLLSFAHLIPAIVVFYLYWKKFDIPDIFKILFSFSYFLVFEYGIVNRGYILVILCLFAAVYFLKKDNRQGLAWSLLLLCQTEVFGVFMALALAAYLYLTDKKQYAKPLQYTAIGLIIFVISVFPRESGHIAKTQGKILTFGDRILTSWQGNLTNAFLPGVTPDTSLFGWNMAGILLTAALLAGAWFTFRHDKKILITFALVLAMSFGFSLLFFVGGIRQWGMMAVFFMALLAMTDLKSANNLIPFIFIFMLGLVQGIYGIKALQSDINMPFSNARAAGLYIKEKIPEKVPVVAINKFEITPVIGYAKRKFYELPSGEPFSYFKWVEKIYIPTQEELRLFAKYKGVGGLVIIAPKKLDPGRFSEAVLGKEFTAKNIKNENYYLYTLSAR